MSYEILNNELFSDDKPDKKSSKKDKIKINSDDSIYEKEDKKKDFKFEFKQFYIHLSVIIIILLSLIFFFTSDFSFTSTDNIEDKVLVLVGDLDTFNKTLNGNLSLYSADFEITYQNGVLNDESKDIIIENYNGSIYLENNSIIFDGVASKLLFGKNNLNLNMNNFKLISKIKTTVDFLIPELGLNFNNGRIVFGDVLNYEFENASISLNNFNTTMSYDGLFSFSGYATQFTLNSNKDNLILNYKK